jgi:hypothetical protein
LHLPHVWYSMVQYHIRYNLPTLIAYSRYIYTSECDITASGSGSIIIDISITNQHVLWSSILPWYREPLCSVHSLLRQSSQGKEASWSMHHIDCHYAFFYFLDTSYYFVEWGMVEWK